MKKKLKVLFLAENTANMPLVCKIINGFGYGITPTCLNPREDLLGVQDSGAWDLVICLLAGSDIMTKTIVPFICNHAREIPWLAICEEIDKEDILGAIDAGCIDIVPINEEIRLEIGLYRLIKEKEKRLKNKSVLARIDAEKDKLNLTLSSIGDGVITTDAQQKILMMNEGAAKITGWGTRIAPGRPLAEIFNIVDQNSGESLYGLVCQSLERGEVLGLKKDTILISKSGSSKYLSACISPIKVSTDTVGLVIVFRDITCIRRTEKRVLAEQQNLQLVCATMPIGIILVDDEGLVRKANRLALEVLGKNSGDVIDKRLFANSTYCKEKQGGKIFESEKICLEHGLHRVYMENLKMLGEATPSDGDTRFSLSVYDDKRGLWLKISSAVIEIDGRDHVLLAIDDVTSMKIAEEALGRYHLLSEHANDIIIFFDYNGKIIEANKAALTSYGYTESEMLNKSITDLFGTEYFDESSMVRSGERTCSICNSGKIPKNESELQAWIAGGAYYEAIARKKDGDTFFIEVSFQSAVIGSSKVVLSIQRDITERIQVLEELERARQRAEAANMAKSKFLANMSHEIRTPLNGMVGMIDLTLLTELTKGQKDNLRIAKDCAATLLNLINDILDFSRLEAGKLMMEEVSFDLRELMEVAIKPHGIKAQAKKLQLDLSIDRAIPRFICGDPNRLKQVINNLLDNAIKFTGEGSVKVSVSLQKKTGNRLELLFLISDTGIGIEEKDLKNIFGTFNQADNSITRKYGGSGLGLTISRELVKMMEGKLWVQSRKGIGSNFYFTVTAAPGEKELHPPQEIATIEKTANPLKILLAEDDLRNQVVLTRIIKKAGHYVELANNGLEVLDRLSKEQFDLVLMDIQMPEMDGLETVKRIRRKEKGKKERMPIIALTAHALPGDREKYLSMGMDDYIAKPVHLNNLLAVIENAASNTYKIKDESASSNAKDIYNILIQKEIDGEFAKNKSKVINDIAELIEGLAKACKEKNFPAIERNAHAIKSLASKVGWTVLRQGIFKVELAARKEDIKKVVEKFALFLQTFEVHKDKYIE